MTKDGPETGNIAERLKAKSAADTKALEDVIRNAHQQLAQNLQQSSRAALKQCSQSLDTEIAGIMNKITEIDSQVSQAATRMNMRLGEIEINPARTMRKTAVIAALIGAGMAMLPWAVMSWLGINAMQSNGEAIDRLMAEREEKKRISELGQIEVVTVRGETRLMLPEGTNQIYICGPEKRPCIRLEN